MPCNIGLHGEATLKLSLRVSDCFLALLARAYTLVRWGVGSPGLQQHGWSSEPLTLSPHSHPTQSHTVPAYQPICSCPDQGMAYNFMYLHWIMAPHNIQLSCTMLCWVH